MPERRHIYADRITHLAMAPPDDRTMHLLWQIVDEGVLGASNHVRLTQTLLLHLFESVPDPAEAWHRADCAARFIAETRGADAPVVGNAIRVLLEGLALLPAEERAAVLTNRVESWTVEAGQRLARLVKAAVETIGVGRTVIAYDYSSTVAAVVEALWRTDPRPRVIVPESRGIAGGRRYLEAFARSGIAVRFVLDAAFEHILDSRSVVLLGAESMRCDGSLANTIGSRPLARLARWRGCPVYGCTDLLKLDLRSYRGVFVEPEARLFKHLLDGAELPNDAAVTTMSPELEIVPPELLTAFLTDYGPVPPAAIWSLGRELYDEARVGEAPEDASR